MIDSHLTKEILLIWTYYFFLSARFKLRAPRLTGKASTTLMIFPRVCYQTQWCKLFPSFALHIVLVTVTW